jgi:hypothetical protein
MPSRILVIEINEDEKSVTITDGTGHTTRLESVAVIGGDTTNERVYVKMYGASADAAWAFGQAFKISLQKEHRSTALENFMKQAALHCVTICTLLEADGETLN